MVAVLCCFRPWMLPPGVLLRSQSMRRRSLLPNISCPLFLSPSPFPHTRKKCYVLTRVLFIRNVDQGLVVNGMPWRSVSCLVAISLRENDFSVMTEYMTMKRERTATANLEVSLN